MKYLRIHYFMAIVVITFYSSLEFTILYLLKSMPLLLWNFKIPRNLWSRYLDDCQKENTYYIGGSYDKVDDKTLYDTIKRRYSNFIDYINNF